MLARGAGNREHVVERHGDVGDDDLERRLGEGLPLSTFRNMAVGVQVLPGQRFAHRMRVSAGRAQLPPHFPAHPEKQDSACKEQADDREKPRRDGGEEDAQHGRRGDTDEDRLGSLLRREPGGGEPDDDGVVAGQNEIDQDDLQKRRQRVGGDEIEHAAHPSRVAAAATFSCRNV